MKTNLTLKILKDVLEKTDITHIELVDALAPVYIEYDDELEPEEDQEYPDEFDLILHGNHHNHATIQAIDELLSDYSYVEMRFRHGQLEIFQSDREKEEMEVQKLEKYFVVAINEDGTLEPVIWFKTLAEAQKEAKEWKKKYPTNASSIYVGEILFEKRR